MTCRFVSYLRVSTTKQGVTGLGIEAQRASVTAFALARGCTVIAEYVEAESGKKDDRPQLALAMAHARRSRAQLLIARLDRLTRSTSLLEKLRAAKVDFLAADMPDANKMTISILAAVAEQERENISRNTRLAMAAAKLRPIETRPTYGNPMGFSHICERLPECRAMGRAAHSAKTKAYALSLASTIADIKARGPWTLASIAAALNADTVPTTDREPIEGEARRWHPSAVARLLSRLPA